jgi:CubicO group peptidase (beta-lactamase class C family)
MNDTEPRDLVRAIDEIFAPWNRSDQPGYVVGVAYQGQTVFRRGLGLACVSLGVANSPATRMRIGSVSKHFTCLAAFLLQEDGKLDVHANVRQYWPELPPVDAEPTLLQLMHHMSGYRDVIGLGMISSGIHIPQGADMPLARMQRQTGSNFAPGERMMYNNGAYHLLSLIIERVAGMPFEAFLKTRIFDPLGMCNTDSLPDDMHQHPGMATLHVPVAAGGYRSGAFPVARLLGEGAMVSTVDDMLLWLAHLRGEKRVGSANTWAQMLARPTFASGAKSEYAAGLIVNRYRGVDVIQHSGGVVGGACQMLTIPPHALDIIFMTNMSLPADLIRQGFDVVDAVLGDKILGDPPRTPAKSADRSALTGWFSVADTRDVYEIVDLGETLAIREMEGPPLPLFAGAEGLEVEMSVFGSLVMTPGEGAASWRVRRCGKPMRFDRMDTGTVPLDDIARCLAGTFASDDMIAVATLFIEGEALLFDLQVNDGRTRYRIEPVTRDVVKYVPVDPGVPFSGILHLDRQAPQARRFWLGNYNNRNVEFTRMPLPTETTQTMQISALMELR